MKKKLSETQKHTLRLLEILKGNKDRYFKRGGLAFAAAMFTVLLLFTFALIVTAL